MIGTVLILIGAALVMEMVDSSLGMMYGTLLTPILISSGYAPAAAVPAILISQAVGGTSGTLMHHRFGNGDFKGLTKDMKIVLAIVIPGLLVTILGVFLAVKLPSFWVKVYIGTLVTIMGLLCLFPFRFNFAWWKQYIIGIIAAFNKAISGGGFGPLVSTGGILGGLRARTSVATTTFSEVIVCVGAFIVYLLFKGKMDMMLTYSLCIGAFVGGAIGPYICSKGSQKFLRIAVGGLAVISGIWVLVELL